MTIITVFAGTIWGEPITENASVAHTCPDECTDGILSWHCERCQEEFSGVSQALDHELIDKGPVRKYLYCAACKVVVSTNFPPPAFKDKLDLLSRIIKPP